MENLRLDRDAGQTQTRADAPVRSIEPEFWSSARVVMPPWRKTSIHLRIDGDVLDWFKSQGEGHLTRMNAVLRSHMDANKNSGK